MTQRVHWTCAAAAVLVMTMAGHAGAQAKADFSGTWQLDRARSGGGSGGGAMMMSGGAASTGATASASGTGASTSGARSGGGGGGTMMSGGAAPTIEITIAQSAAALTIARALPNGVSNTTYKLDGSESVNTVGSTTTTTKSHWDGARLVTEGTQQSGDITGTVKEIRSLDKDGSLVVEIERHTSALPAPVTSRQVYTKKK